MPDYQTLGYLAGAVSVVAGLMLAVSVSRGDDADAILARAFPFVLGVILAMTLLGLAGEL